MPVINNDYRVLQRFLELQDWVANNIKANVDIPSGSSTTPLVSLKIGNQIYSITGGGGGGSLTGIGLSMPSAFTVSPSGLITQTGTFTVEMADGYTIPTIIEINKWNSLTFNPTVPTGITPTSLTTLLYNNTYYSIDGGSVSSVNLSYVKSSNITTGVSLSVDGTVTSTLNTQNDININNNTDLQKLATAYGVYKSVVMPQPTIESGQSTYQIPNFTQNNIMVGGSNPTIGNPYNYYIKDSGYSITATIDTTATQSNSLPTVEAVKTYVQGVISSMTYNGELE